MGWGWKDTITIKLLILSLYLMKYQVFHKSQNSRPDGVMPEGICLSLKRISPMFVLCSCDSFKSNSNLIRQLN